MRPLVASTVLCPFETLLAPSKRSATQRCARRTFTIIAHCQWAGDIFMDEARTLSLLAWIIGGIVGVLFILQAIALSLS